MSTASDPISTATTIPVLPVKSKYARLTPAQWEIVTTLWELGKVTYRDLSEMFDITEESLRAGLKKRGAKKGSRVGEVGEAILEQSKAQTTLKLERIDAMKERYLSYGDVLGKLTMKEVTEAVRASAPLSTRKENIAAIQKAAAIMAVLRAESYHLLGLNDENAITEELPELGITEYTADELEQIRRGFELVEDDPLDDETFELDLPFEDEEALLK
jgi:hypothetical protein